MEAKKAPALALRALGLGASTEYWGSIPYMGLGVRGLRV